MTIFTHGPRPPPGPPPRREAEPDDVDNIFAPRPGVERKARPTSAKVKPGIRIPPKPPPRPDVFPKPWWPPKPPPAKSLPAKR